MARIKPIDLIAEMSGRVCTHSQFYFSAHKNGKIFTGRLCHPAKPSSTAAAREVRTVFQNAVEWVNQIMLDQDAVEPYRVAWRKQSRIQNFRNYLMSVAIKEKKSV